MKEKPLDERLKRYEALLEANGIDPNQAPDSSEVKHLEKSNCAKAPETIWQLPTPTPTVSGPQSTIFKPQLLQGQKGTKLVDK